MYVLPSHKTHLNPFLKLDIYSLISKTCSVISVIKDGVNFKFFIVCTASIHSLSLESWEDFAKEWTYSTKPNKYFTDLLYLTIFFSKICFCWVFHINIE